MKLAFDSDQGFGRRAALGLIVLQADETIEPEFRILEVFLGLGQFRRRQVGGTRFAGNRDRLSRVTHLLDGRRRLAGGEKQQRERAGEASY